jgi:flavin reductase (DIM6/NTAB) family NADH-FMN oxidoreductase RutF
MQSTDPATIQLGKALGRIPSGVFILTAAAPDGAAQAMMASWVQQASFQPPTISIAIAKGRPIGQLIKRTMHLALAILPEDDTTLMKRYARGVKPGEDPFAGVGLIVLSNGVPAPRGALGYMAATLIQTVDFNSDHELLIAEITAGRIEHAGPAFTHQRGGGFHY